VSSSGPCPLSARSSDALAEVLRTGAQRLLAGALAVDSYGHRPVEVEQPRVLDIRGAEV
jgi:hypothetical protein